MVKFAKTLKRELIPEWSEGYVNYKALKQTLNQISQSEPVHGPGGDAFGSSEALLEVSGGNKSGQDRPKKTWGPPLMRSKSDGAPNLRKLLSCKHIDVEVQQGDTATGKTFHTHLLPPFDASAGEVFFFAQLDAQLNKVNSFYRKREEEHVSRFQQLERQVSALDRLKDVLEDSGKDSSWSLSSKLRRRSPSPGSSRSGGLGKAGKPRGGELNDLAELSISSGRSCEDLASLEPDNGRPGGMDIESGTLSRTRSGFQDHIPPAEGLRLELPAATPLRSIQKLMQLVQEDLTERRARARAPAGSGASSDSSGHSGRSEPRNGVRDGIRPANRRTLKSAEGLLREALKEFYRGLGLLREFRALNYLAFEKILKKHDRRLGCSTARTYLDAVQTAHFQKSMALVHLTASTETLFARRFARDRSHAAAVRELRPKHRSASHMVSYALGFFSGSVVALLVFFVTILSLAGGYDDAGGPEYVDSVFPIFIPLILLLVHMYCYGLNTYWWRATTVNYAFLFEVKPNHELRFREVLLVATLMSAITVGGMALHLVFNHGGNHMHGDHIPLAIWLIWIGIFVCPFDIFWRSTRRWLAKTMGRVFLAPFYRVTQADFIMADQLSSQIVFLQYLQYTICYYGAGHFRTRDGLACTSDPTYGKMLYVLAVLPFYFRFAQCWRRYFEEGRVPLHFWNGVKYICAMIAISFRLWYLETLSTTAFVFCIVSAVITTIYQVYWDLVIDWGLLRARARNPWLRDKLLAERKWVYFAAMGMDVLLRLAFLQTIERFQIPIRVHDSVIMLIVGLLEVMRRGIWNYFRIENDHLFNVGLLRAVRPIPLPVKNALGVEV